MPGTEALNKPGQRMVARLVAVGTAIAEHLNKDLDDTFACAPYSTRRDALEAAFDALDWHGRGTIGHAEMRAMATLTSPPDNAKHVRFYCCVRASVLGSGIAQ